MGSDTISREQVSRLSSSLGGVLKHTHTECSQNHTSLFKTLMASHHTENKIQRPSAICSLAVTLTWTLRTASLTHRVSSAEVAAAPPRPSASRSQLSSPDLFPPSTQGFSSSQGAFPDLSKVASQLLFTLLYWFGFSL